MGSAIVDPQAEAEALGRASYETAEEALEDVATAAAIYSDARRRMAERRDDLIGLLRNFCFTDPADKRFSIKIGDVEIRRFKRFVTRCTCHQAVVDECPDALSGAAVNVHRVEVDPSFDVRFRKDRSDT